MRCPSERRAGREEIRPGSSPRPEAAAFRRPSVSGFPPRSSCGDGARGASRRREKITANHRGESRIPWRRWETSHSSCRRKGAWKRRRRSLLAGWSWRCAARNSLTISEPSGRRPDATARGSSGTSSPCGSRKVYCGLDTDRRADFGGSEAEEKNCNPAFDRKPNQFPIPPQ